MRRYLVTAVVVCLIARTAFAGYGDQVSPGVPSYEERVFFSIVNAARVDAANYRISVYGNDYSPSLPPFGGSGVAPLFMSNSLRSVAYWHSNDMASNNCAQRDDCIGGGTWGVRVAANYQCGGSTYGEAIIANTAATTPRIAVNKLLCSGVGSCCSTGGSCQDRDTLLSATSQFAGAGNVLLVASTNQNHWTVDLADQTCPAETDTSTLSHLAQPLTDGTHVTDFPSTGSIHFMANYYDPQGLEPLIAEVVIEGTCISMVKYLGTSNGLGTYIRTQTSYTGCRAYYFQFTSGTGQVYTFPATGSLITYGEGGCANQYTTQRAACGQVTPSVSPSPVSASSSLSASVTPSESVTASISESASSTPVSVSPVSVTPSSSAPPPPSPSATASPAASSPASASPSPSSASPPSASPSSSAGSAPSQTPISYTKIDNKDTLPSVATPGSKVVFHINVTPKLATEDLSQIVITRVQYRVAGAGEYRELYGAIEAGLYGVTADAAREASVAFAVSNGVEASYSFVVAIPSLMFPDSPVAQSYEFLATAELTFVSGSGRRSIGTRVVSDTFADSLTVSSASANALNAAAGSTPTPAASTGLIAGVVVAAVVAVAAVVVIVVWCCCCRKRDKRSLSAAQNGPDPRLSAMTTSSHTMSSSAETEPLNFHQSDSCTDSAPAQFGKAGIKKYPLTFFGSANYRKLTRHAARQMEREKLRLSRLDAGLKMTSSVHESSGTESASGEQESRLIEAMGEDDLAEMPPPPVQPTKHTPHAQRDDPTTSSDTSSPSTSQSQSLPHKRYQVYATDSSELSSREHYTRNMADAKKSDESPVRDTPKREDPDSPPRRSAAKSRRDSSDTTSSTETASSHERERNRSRARDRSRTRDRSSRFICISSDSASSADVPCTLNDSTRSPAALGRRSGRSESRVTNGERRESVGDALERVERVMRNSDSASSGYVARDATSSEPTETASKSNANDERGHRSGSDSDRVRSRTRHSRKSSSRKSSRVESTRASTKGSTKGSADGSSRRSRKRSSSKERMHR